MLAQRYGALRRLRKAILAAALGVALLPALSATAEPVTIAALGDSLTQGFGLPPEDGLVPQLERWLAARDHDVVLVNAGVSGDTTAGGLARIGWTLTPEVDALIVALGGNDMLRGIDPAVSRANLDGILSAAAEAGLPVLLAGLRGPGNYGPDYKAAFEAMYPALAAEHGAVLLPDMLAPLRDDPAAALGRYLQPDGLHPNADGVALIVDTMGPAVEKLIAQSEP